jgi:hypothetical protein
VSCPYAPEVHALKLVDYHGSAEEALQSIERYLAGIERGQPNRYRVMPEDVRHMKLVARRLREMDERPLLWRNAA